MGYVLNQLSNLPVDDNINFYIFVVNGQYHSLQMIILTI